jgi:hypothetical protein
MTEKEMDRLLDLLDKGGASGIKEFYALPIADQTAIKARRSAMIRAALKAPDKASDKDRKK